MKNLEGLLSYAKWKKEKISNALTKYENHPCRNESNLKGRLTILEEFIDLLEKLDV